MTMTRKLLAFALLLTAVFFPRPAQAHWHHYWHPLFIEDELWPPVYAQPVAAPAGASPAGFYYYCEKLHAYYPSAPTCPEPWIAIPVGAPPPRDPVPAATAEDVRARPNVASFEFFGRAFSYSFDFERAISDRLAIGTGISNWQMSDWWSDQSATITVIPLYANYYFTEQAERGFVSLGAEYINASPSGINGASFANTGVAGVVGVGYEMREKSGFVLRVSAFAIIGRSVNLSPSLSLGYAF